MASRDDRVARNEARFREENELLRERFGEIGAFDGGGRDQLTPFLCECGDLGCTDVILLLLDEYERVRADPNTFAIVNGHQMEDSETVVTGEVCEENDRFAVVKKDEPARRITEATDPRAP